MHSRLIE